MMKRFSCLHRRVVYALMIASTACILIVRPVQAQSKPFRLFGVISDLDAFPLEGVRVELVDATTQATTSATTDAAGRFELKVPAGRYRTRVLHSEFEMSTEEGMEMLAGAAMTLDVSLPAKNRPKAGFCFSAACVDRLPGIEAPQTAEPSTTPANR